MIYIYLKFRRKSQGKRTRLRRNQWMGSPEKQAQSLWRVWGSWEKIAENETIKLSRIVKKTALFDLFFSC